MLLAAGAAVAAESRSHVVNIALPDGAVAQIHYEGDRAPSVAVARAGPAPVSVFERVPISVLRTAPVVIPMTGLDMRPALADFARLSAMMEMQSRAMMRQMARMAQMQRHWADAPGAARMVSAGQAPAGVVEYRYVSTTSRDGCTTSVQWSTDGSGAQPKVVRASSGTCGADAHSPLPTKAPETGADGAAIGTAKTVPGARRT